ncbi:hypothetical protein SDC9_89931 [bioreactor metagenome]|uniref:Uncharacterized protein n=1 Tax=bioreactor metagenome TaxID=1076179 RepID=A0A644ZS90_9ZZZZ
MNLLFFDTFVTHDLLDFEFLLRHVIALRADFRLLIWFEDQLAQDVPLNEN